LASDADLLAAIVIFVAVYVAAAPGRLRRQLPAGFGASSRPASAAAPGPLRRRLPARFGGGSRPASAPGPMIACGVLDFRQAYSGLDYDTIILTARRDDRGGQPAALRLLGGGG